MSVNPPKTCTTSCSKSEQWSHHMFMYCLCISGLPARKKGIASNISHNMIKALATCAWQRRRKERKNTAFCTVRPVTASSPKSYYTTCYPWLSLHSSIALIRWWMLMKTGEKQTYVSIISRSAWCTLHIKVFLNSLHIKTTKRKKKVLLHWNQETKSESTYAQARTHPSEGSKYEFSVAVLIVGGNDRRIAKSQWPKIWGGLNKPFPRYGIDSTTYHTISRKSYIFKLLTLSSDFAQISAEVCFGQFRIMPLCAQSFGYRDDQNEKCACAPRTVFWIYEYCSADRLPEKIFLFSNCQSQIDVSGETSGRNWCLSWARNSVKGAQDARRRGDSREISSRILLLHRTKILAQRKQQLKMCCLLTVTLPACLRIVIAAAMRTHQTTLIARKTIPRLLDFASSILSAWRHL